MSKYNVTVKAFGQERVMNVIAKSFAEAQRIARTECGVTIEAKLVERG